MESNEKLSKTVFWISYGMSGLVILFMLMDRSILARLALQRGLE
jgi:hypothetical protein